MIGKLCCIIAVFGLAACGQSTTPGPSTTTGVGTSAATTAPASSQRLALVPATVIGSWSFDGSCASEDGMSLRADGKVAVGEAQQGLWGIDGEGRLVVLTQQYEPGDLTSTPQGGAAEFYAFEMRTQGELVSVDTTAPQPIHAKLCPPS
jgi:hypothetical protein